jgi:peptidoglycan/xylan/chitin deacetylase (PgdA/CDA1 family)
MLADLYSAGLRASGASALVRRVRSGGLILCYHNVISVGPATGDAGLHLAANHFAEQMKWLARHYAIVSLTEFANRLATNRSLRRLAVVTFDDGYQGVFDHGWPVLRALGIPGTVFIPTDLIQRGHGFWWDHPSFLRDFSPARRQACLTEFQGDADVIAHALLDDRLPLGPAAFRPADWTTIARAAADGLDLGVHSATHRNLTCLSDSDLMREVLDSREKLVAACGVRAETFAYPYGIFDARVQAAVRRAGYRAAVTVEYGLNSAGTDPWTLRRVNVPATISAATFDAWSAGLRPRFRARI